MSVLPEPGAAAGVGALTAFRAGFYQCLTARADILFDPAEALLCQSGPVTSLPALSLSGVFRRGHGALYDALGAGQVDTNHLRDLLAGQTIGRVGGRIVLAVDVTNWLCPDANRSPDRLFCHVYGRGRSADQFIPGWPYSMVAALESGASSWTQILDAARIGPDDDVQAVTAGQVRSVVERLIAAGQHAIGDEPILVVADAGYNAARLAWCLRDLPVTVTARVRSDRVFYARPKHQVTAGGRGGRAPKHGTAHRLSEPDSWETPTRITACNNARYGRLEAKSWDRLHPRLTQRSAWIDAGAQLPVLDGTLTRLTVDHLPHDGSPKPVWLWTSAAGLSETELDGIWTGWLRRFDIEHTFRFLKQTLGCTTSRPRTPAQADLWTWLVIAAFTQLRIARTLVADLRLLWEAPAELGKLTPARVRRGFANLRLDLDCPARAPKPSRPGPGRPKGRRNTRRAPVYDPGKTTKRDRNLTQRKKPLKVTKPSTS
ncbi:NF041680 family putative transposase [Glycomyces harbinensis]|uniref:DDE superfamily endonuclease n=1 Tax=Glycomyces harbinensis TaxID=58114 RepID=A0A1G6XQA0_9ACTN|nr:NF041680 family putative transposase [Glycomyces harbinensis]SDD80330.1 DDE superfamily endonuclease [Glycomyces harbinensis]